MTIQKLLLLESEAQEAMRTLEKDQAAASKKAEDDLATKITRLEEENATAIRELIRKSEAQTTIETERIKADYRQRGSELQTAFATNRTLWVEKIIKDVLFV